MINKCAVTDVCKNRPWAARRISWLINLNVCEAGSLSADDSNDLHRAEMKRSLLWRRLAHASRTCKRCPAPN